jgi:hypothetical protein
MRYADPSRFKIYLIDEVHMLSTHSFNALLKTLEEPPPHVKFSGDHRSAETAGYRAVAMPAVNLKRLPVKLIAARMQQILEAEKSTRTGGAATAGAIRRRQSACTVTARPAAGVRRWSLGEPRRAPCWAPSITYAWCASPSVAAGAGGDDGTHSDR